MPSRFRVPEAELEQDSDPQPQGQGAGSAASGPRSYSGLRSVPLPKDSLNRTNAQASRKHKDQIRLGEAARRVVAHIAAGPMQRDAVETAEKHLKKCFSPVLASTDAYLKARPRAALTTYSELIVTGAWMHWQKRRFAELVQELEQRTTESHPCPAATALV